MYFKPDGQSLGIDSGPWPFELQDHDSVVSDRSGEGSGVCGLLS